MGISLADADTNILLSFLRGAAQTSNVGVYLFPFDSCLIYKFALVKYRFTGIPMTSRAHGAVVLRYHDILRDRRYASIDIAFGWFLLRMKNYLVDSTLCHDCCGQILHPETGLRRLPR